MQNGTKAEGRSNATDENIAMEDAVPTVQNYGFHSMCLQIKDPKKSIKFYKDMFGMEMVKATESDDYSMYFLGFPPANTTDNVFGSRTGLLQLVHVHGSEDDDSFEIKRGDPGFSHFTISVPDVERAKCRLDRLGVEILEDGSNVRGFAAVADPDGYHVQLIAQNLGQDDRLRAELEKLMSSNTGTTMLNSTTLARKENPPSKALLLARGGSPVSTHTRSPM